LTLREGLRIAPYADTLRPRVAHGLLRAQHFKLRTGHRLLCARHLTVRSENGSLRNPRSAPCVERGLLRAQHLEFCTGPGLLLVRHLSLRTVHRLLCVRRLPLICCLRISPHSSLSGLVLIADYSVFNTYAPRWDLLVTLTPSPPPPGSPSESARFPLAPRSRNLLLGLATDHRSADPSVFSGPVALRVAPPG